MKRSSFYVPVDGVYPFTGLNATIPSTLMTPAGARKLTNMCISKGYMKKRSGYSVLGSAVNGIPLKFISFENSSGQLFLIVVTTTKVYYWNSTAWADITPTRNKVEIHGAETNNLAAGDVVIQDNTLARGKIISHDATHIYIDVYYGGFNATDLIKKDALNYWTPSGSVVETANGGSALSFSTDGVDEKCNVDYITVTALEGTWVIITNGLSEPFYWDGSASKCTPLLSHPDIEMFDVNFVTCKGITYFNGHIFLTNINISGTWYPTQVVWGDAQSLLDFANGTSGSTILSNVGGLFRTAIPLADRLAIYADDSITLCTYVGGEAIFNFELMVANTSLLSPKAIADLKQYHYYMNTEALLMYDGTRIDRSISDAVFSEMREIIDHEQKEKAFVYVDKVKNHCYNVIPTSSTTSKIYLLEYDPVDPINNHWCDYEFDKRPTCIGSFVQQSAKTWESYDDDVTTWEDMAGTWNQSQLKVGSAIRLIGFSDGTIGWWDDLTTTDAGTDVTAVFESMDFTIPQEYKSEEGRWISLEVELSGTDGAEVQVEVSPDEGQTWIECDPITLTYNSTVHEVFFDFSSQTFRFRLTTTANMTIRWYRAQVTPNGRY